MKVDTLKKIRGVLDDLSSDEQLILLEDLAKHIRQSVQSPKRHWREFRGLGKEIWQDINSEKYIEDLRREWE